MRQIISVFVENKFGVLSRVAGLFSGRGYNIESLSVGVVNESGHSIMTIVTEGDERVVEQITKQLRKLVNIIKVRNVTTFDHIEREMLLIKIKATDKNRPDIFNIVNTFRGKTIDLSSNSMVVEITGANDKTGAFINVLEPYGIIEIIRTGSVAIARGDQITTNYSSKNKQGEKP